MRDGFREAVPFVIRKSVLLNSGRVHIDQFPNMPVKIHEAGLIHKPVVFWIGCRAAARFDRFVYNVVHLLPAFRQEGDHDFHVPGRINNGFVCKVLEEASVSNMANVRSLITMQAEVSSVNCRLNENPMCEKKWIDFLRSLTGRLINVMFGLNDMLHHPAYASSAYFLKLSKIACQPACWNAMG